MISSYYRIMFTILIPITLIVVYDDIVTRGSSLVNYVSEYSLVKLRYPKNRRNNKGCCCSCNADDKDDNVGSDTRVNSRNNDCQPLRSCLRSGPSRNLNVRFNEVDGGHPGDTNHPKQRPHGHCVSNGQLIDGRDPHPRKNSIENPPSAYFPQGPTYLDEEEEEKEDGCSSSRFCSCKRKKKHYTNPYANYDGGRSTIFHPQTSEDSNPQHAISNTPESPSIPPPPFYPPPPPPFPPQPATAAPSLPPARSPSPPLSRSASFAPADTPPSPQTPHSPPTSPPLPHELIYKLLTSEDHMPSPIPPRATKKHPIRPPNQPENSFSPEDIMNGFLSLRSTGSIFLPVNSVITNRNGKWPCDDDLNSPEDTNQNIQGTIKPNGKDPVVPVPQRPATSTLQRPIGPSIPKHKGPTLPKPKEQGKPEPHIPHRLSNVSKNKKDPNSKVTKLAEQLHEAISAAFTNPLHKGISVTTLFKQRGQESNDIPQPPVPEVEVPHSHSEPVDAPETGASGGDNQG
ncbi:hypothetical protein OJ253_2024 [Cryptosporidium canis]|uniref:Uncharacterized protein n=1 Tax=Cryptosporidium canis TaxID=195482 RepID=A0A9D5DIA2_9CRYT|nr:hypothetical protein OJ253_2024 [Cryptosporidium canis]